MKNVAVVAIAIEDVLDLSGCVVHRRGYVIWVDGGHDLQNAESIIKMAVMRQGVEDRFFTKAFDGEYKAGDKFNGSEASRMREEVDPGSTIEIIGGMAFPKGPRGLAR